MAIWQFGTAELDARRRELRVAGSLRTIEGKPLALLLELLCRAGEVMTKTELLDAVWPGVTVVEGSLSTAINKIRYALGPQTRAAIEVVHGVGYRVAVPTQLRASPRAQLAFVLRERDPVPGRPQWRLVRPLGPNRPSATWLAENESSGEVRVFKFADSAERLQAIKREAATCRKLHDRLGERPDLPQLRDCDFEARPYYIESSYGGHDLSEWAACRGGLAGIALDERVAIVARIARTIAAAQDVGVLHGDIKPANIRVAEGDGGIAKICLVGFQDSGFGSDEASTGHNVDTSLATVAPELLTGRARTAAADVFALGMLLYQVVVGDLHRPLAAGWENDVTDPLLRLDIIEAANGDIGRRLPHARILAERLEGLDARRRERETQEREVAAGEALARTAERRRLDAIASADQAATAMRLSRRLQGMVVALLVMTAVASTMLFYAQAQRRLADAQRDRAEQLTGAARGAVSSLIDAMAMTLRDKAGVSLDLLQQLLSQADAIVGRMTRLAPADGDLQRLEARALGDFADVYLHKDELAQALDAAERAAALQQVLVSDQPSKAVLRRELSQSFRWIGDVKLRQRDLAAAMRAYEAGLGIMTALAASQPANADFQQRLARALMAKGDVQVLQDDNAQALATFRQARQVLERGLPSHAADPGWQLDLSTAEEKAGDALAALGDHAGALAAYEPDLSIRQRLLALDPQNTRYTRDVAVALSDVGDEQSALHDMQAALAAYQAAFSINQGLLVSDPSNVSYVRDIAASYSAIGSTEGNLGKPNEAARAFELGLSTIQSITQRSPGDVDSQALLLELETSYAKLLIHQGELSQAEPYVSDALGLARRLVGAHPSDTNLVDDLAAARQLQTSFKPATSAQP